MNTIYLPASLAMATTAHHRAASTNWMAVLAGLVFCTGACLVVARYLDEVMRDVPAHQESELALPLSSIVHESPPRPTPLSREEENWNRVTLGSFSLELPGIPRDDQQPGWLDHYDGVERLAAYALPVEHRQCHVRASAIHYGKGRISLHAASLAAKHGIETEFRGVTTILPFDFRDLPSRHLASRPVNVDEFLRQHTYLVIHGQEVLLLCVKGHDTHPSRLAHQILRTVEVR